MCQWRNKICIFLMGETLIQQQQQKIKKKNGMKKKIAYKASNVV